MPRSPAAAVFNAIALQEYIPLGQRVENFTVSCEDTETGEWKAAAEGTTIGYKRILRFDAVTAGRVKIDISSLAGPELSSISIYNSPEM